MKRIVPYLWHPLGVLWLLFAAAIAGGIIEWVFFDRPPWEGLGAAVAIAGVVQIVAYVKGIPAWPWSPPPRAADREE
jgi:hypothetical protein